MNILVTGASGQLGRAIMELSCDSRHRFIFTSRIAGEKILGMDVTDADAVSRAVGPDVDIIINCSAYTDVNAAEDNPEAAHAVNAVAAGILAKAAAASGALLIHVSTDYVFDGLSNTPYREEDATAPLNVYGQSKLDGELAVAASGCRYIILRTSWLYSCCGSNFFTVIAEKTAACPHLKVVYDQIGSPTYAADLAYAIMHIIDNGMTDAVGIYHYSDEGLCSRYDFAKEICDSLGHICTIVPCRSDEYPSKARRPHYSVLDKSLFRATFGLEIPNWKDSLRLCIAEMGNIKKIE